MSNTYSKLLSEWSRGRDTVNLRLDEDGNGFRAEYLTKGEEKPLGVLRFRASNGLERVDLFKHVQTVENWLFDSGYHGIIHGEF